MDELQHRNSMDSDKDFSGSQSSKQVLDSNCFEPGDHVKSDNGEIVDHMASYLTGDLESVDLNDTSNDCLERKSPTMTDTSTSMTDSASASITDSPVSVHSGSKKKR